jgi:ribosomal protein S18 acetylase RimI-like enzyme
VRALTRVPEGSATIYVARRSGEPAGCLMTVDHARNTEIQMVAVVPEARGAGIAGGLLRHGLADAAERGVETSTLIATRMGQPTYERIGYRGLGRMTMWERAAEG